MEGYITEWDEKGVDGSHSPTAVEADMTGGSQHLGERILDNLPHCCPSLSGPKPSSCTESIQTEAVGLTEAVDSGIFFCSPWAANLENIVLS